MTTSTNAKISAHLSHLIVSRSGDIPNFSLLLGAGASSTSDVRTAQEMIIDWRRMLFYRSESEMSYEIWLEEQYWYEHEDEYSILFELIYDQPAQRRVCIEECVKKTQPNWGYVYLTNLLSSRFFDVIFTTNFDDLINEACYLYSDGVRPIVAAHDSVIQGIRVTSGRPKIIKLHGDFLYDNIKNTLAELETLEANTKRKLHQFAQEYGLVVLGYSGRDRSVMDTLEVLLRDEENYKQGVYWCIRPGSPISSRLESLLRRDRVYLVEVDGFDEFMADLHSEAQLVLPRPIARPFEIARERARLFVDVDGTLSAHPVINAHRKEVLESLDLQSPKLPLPLEAAALSSRREFSQAVLKWKEAYMEEPEDTHIAHSYAEALIDDGKFEEAAMLILQTTIPTYNKTYLLLRTGKNEEVIDLANQVLDDQYDTLKGLMDGQEVVRINRAIALKRLQRTDEMRSDLDYLEQNGYTEEPRIKAGVAALRKTRMTCSPHLMKPFPGHSHLNN